MISFHPDTLHLAAEFFRQQKRLRSNFIRYLKSEDFQKLDDREIAIFLFKTAEHVFPFTAEHENLQVLSVLEEVLIKRSFIPNWRIVLALIPFGFYERKDDIISPRSIKFVLEKDLLQAYREGTFEESLNMYMLGRYGELPDSAKLAVTNLLINHIKKYILNKKTQEKYFEVMRVVCMRKKRSVPQRLKRETNTH